MNTDIYKSKMKPFKDTYVMYWLLEFIDESSIICLCKASKKLNKICKQYIEMEDDKRFEIIVTESRWDHSEYNNGLLLQNYCKNNNAIKIRKIIKIDIWWNGGLYWACENGYIDIVKLMIEKGAKDWNGGLWRACYGGHMDIVKLMIEKGATGCVHNFRCTKTIDQHLSKN